MSRGFMILINAIGIILRKSSESVIHATFSIYNLFPGNIYQAIFLFGGGRM
jgi:hypothetical protein